MKVRGWLISFAGLLVVLVLPSDVHPFNVYSAGGGHNFTWENGRINLRYDPTSFPEGEWRTALEETVALWNESPGQLEFSLEADTGNVRHNNGQSEVWFGRASTAYCQNRYNYATNRVVESDIVFGNQPWTTSTSKGDLWRYGGRNRSFHTTCLHEMGHAVPLAHENREYNIMGVDYEHLHVNGNVARAYVGEDAADGVVFLYRVKADTQDLGVTHWRYNGTSGQYSDHRRTTIVNVQGGALSSYVDQGERTYVVRQGQTVQAEFSYENNGAAMQADVPVGFYLSTDSTITTLDRRIDGTTLTLIRDDVDTRFTTIQIPSDVEPGNYWLGVVVDERDELREIVESNNATYIPIEVRGS